MREPIPLTQRGLDRVFVLGFLMFAATSLYVDRLAALDVDVCAEQRLAGALCWYGRNIDPLYLANPHWLRVLSGISAWVFGPLYLVLAYGFWRGVDAVRGPALAWATCILYSMVLHIWLELFGEHPPANPGAMFLVYAPYIALPIALLWRMRSRGPFSRAVPAASDPASPTTSP